MKVRVCTISDYGAHQTLLASAEINNIEIHNLIVKPWISHGLKLTILKKFARQYLHDPVLFVDACDTLFCNSYAHLEKTVLQLLSNAKIVFSSEKSIYPDQTKDLYQALIDDRTYVPSCNVFKGLNSGVILGLGKDLVDLFDKLSDEEIITRGHGYYGGDQNLVTRWFVDQQRGVFDQPRIAIDHACQLAVSHSDVSEDDLSVGRTTTFRSPSGPTMPCIIHFNGQSFRNGLSDRRFEYLKMIYFNVK